MVDKSASVLGRDVSESEDGEQGWQPVDEPEVQKEYEEEEVEELETPTAHLETRPQEHSRRNLLRRKHEGEKEEEEETEEETEEEEEEELETPTARRETRPQCPEHAATRSIVHEISIAMKQLRLGRAVHESARAERDGQIATLTVEHLTAQNQTFKDHNKTMKKYNETVKEYNETLKKSNETLKESNETLTAQNQRLTAQNQTLLAHNQTLMTENETVTAQNKRLAAIVQRMTVYWNDTGDMCYHVLPTVGWGMGGTIHQGTVAQAEAAGKTRCGSCMQM